MSMPKVGWTEEIPNLILIIYTDSLLSCRVGLRSSRPGAFRVSLHQGVFLRVWWEWLFGEAQELRLSKSRDVNAGRYGVGA